MIQFSIDEFFDIKCFDKAVQLIDQLMEDRFYVSHTGIGYRKINHWDEKGLIRCKRKTVGSDRKFSFADFVWLKIVNELRVFGVPVSTIKEITDEIYAPLPAKEVFEVISENLDQLDKYTGEDKEEFFNFIKTKEYQTAEFDDFGITYLHLLIADAIVGREPTSLIVFNNGEWFPYNPSKENQYSEEIINKKRYSSHISVCLLDIIFQFFQSETIIKFMKDFKLFNSEEQKLLDEIEIGEYKKIKVVYRSKKYESKEIKKLKTIKAQILKIIRDRQYSYFILTYNSGKTKKFKR